MTNITIQNEFDFSQEQIYKANKKPESILFTSCLLIFVLLIPHFNPNFFEWWLTISFLLLLLIGTSTKLVPSENTLIINKDGFKVLSFFLSRQHQIYWNEVSHFIIYKQWSYGGRGSSGYYEVYVGYVLKDNTKEKAILADYSKTPGSLANQLNQWLCHFDSNVSIEILKNRTQILDEMETSHSNRVKARKHDTYSNLISFACIVGFILLVFLLIGFAKLLNALF